MPPPPPPSTRAPPIRPTPCDAWQHPPPVWASYPPDYPIVNSEVMCGPPSHAPVTSTNVFPPKSADGAPSGFPVTPTAETLERWDGAEASSSARQCGSLTGHDAVLPLDQAWWGPLTWTDFGLGFDSFGIDVNSTVHGGDADAVPGPTMMTEPETVNVEPGSPDGRSWSSISDSGSGLVSERSECVGESENRSRSAETIPSVGSVLSSHATSELPQRRFAQPASGGVADSSALPPYRTSPYPTLTGRGRSMSASSVALARSQRGAPSVHGASPSTTVESPPDLSSTSACVLAGLRDMSWDLHGPPMYPRPVLPARPEGKDAPHAWCGPCHRPKRYRMGTPTHPSAEMANIRPPGHAVPIRGEHPFAGSSSPPDLFGPLQEDPLSPPPEDMNADDAEPPRAQELRFEGDRYTPKYVRGHGNKREGWCGICRPGRWLVLKNSAFWYDKSFTHGISAATGSAFESPTETRRMKGNPDVWEGLCHGCGEWIPLISSKKKGTTWFRHAYKVSRRPSHGSGATLTAATVPYPPESQRHAQTATRSVARQSDAVGQSLRHRRGHAPERDPRRGDEPDPDQRRDGGALRRHSGSASPLEPRVKGALCEDLTYSPTGTWTALSGQPYLISQLPRHWELLPRS